MHTYLNLRLWLRLQTGATACQAVFLNNELRMPVSARPGTGSLRLVEVVDLTLYHHCQICNSGRVIRSDSRGWLLLHAEQRPLIFGALDAVHFTPVE